MCNVSQLSTVDLYADVSYLNERIESNAKPSSRSWAKEQSDQECNMELVTESSRRDNIRR